MVFKRMLSAFGVDGPSLGTFLATHRTQPGGTLCGEVRMMSGQFDAEIDQIGLGLLARVGAAQSGEQTGLTEFANAQISGPSVLRQGEERTIEFQVAVPWETPISEIGGRHLADMMLGVRTEVTVAMAVDKGSPDMIAVTPVPVAAPRPAGVRATRLLLQVRFPASRSTERRTSGPAVLPGGRVLSPRASRRSRPRGRVGFRPELVPIERGLGGRQTCGPPFLRRCHWTFPDES
ncbi:hypothetical protein EJK15_20985 [Nonomuraea basaltis]|nr:hypothetical protein EJK15_20985 [Nonomuraea basaltis]